MTTGFAACGFQPSRFSATHLPSVLISGLSAATGAAALATIGFSNIVGTALCGLLGVRYRQKPGAGPAYLTRTALFIAFLALPALADVSVAVCRRARIDLDRNRAADRRPGRRHLRRASHGPACSASLYLGHQFGAFAGAWAGGLSFDRTGSYVPVWAAAILARPAGGTAARGRSAMCRERSSPQHDTSAASPDWRLAVDAVPWRRCLRMADVGSAYRARRAGCITASELPVSS